MATEKVIPAKKVYAFIRYAAPGGGGCVEGFLTKEQQRAMLAMRDFLLEELPTYEEPKVGHQCPTSAREGGRNERSNR